MGWNFGCAIIDFDFHTAVDKLIESERRQFITGAETPEEAQSKALMDVGVAVLEALGFPASPDDAPTSFFDATSREFDGCAVGVIEGKTILVGYQFGVDQDSKKMMAAYMDVSAKYGPVVACWCNDASSTYMVSAFRNGERIRYLTGGPGLSDNEGTPLPGEPAPPAHVYDCLMGILAHVTKRSLSELMDVTLERFSTF